MSKMLVNFIQKVNNNDIREEVLDGHEYIVLPSKTMPSNVVMNRLMYPGAEIDKAIKSIDGSPAPIDHPKINGKYVDARETRAALEFGAGINKLIGKEGDRYSVEKWVNKELLNNTERGKRLLSAINTGSPIHTSIGVFLRPVANSSGKNEYGDYDSEVEIIEFNHDAILPDTIGANTPEKGTGIFVNGKSEDEEFEVMFINMLNEDDDEEEDDKDDKDDDEDEDDKDEKPKRGKFDELVAKVANALGINVKSITNTNSIEVDPMKEKMIAALNAAGIATEGLSDDQLFDKHSQLLSTNATKEVKGLSAEDVAKIVTDKLAANKEAEAKTAKESLVAEVIANSEYKEEDKERLLNTDERILKSFLPKPTAAPIGRPHANSQSETSIINDTMPE